MTTDPTRDVLEDYALALLAVARGEGVLELVEDELFSVARSFEDSDELRSRLADANVPLATRLAVVDDLLGPSGASTVTRALVAFVVTVERAGQLPRIVDAFLDAAAAAREHVVAEVRSAVPLDDERRAGLARSLSRATGKQVEVRVVVDESVVGGIVAHVGDQVIDGSVRSRLEHLRETL